MKPRRRSIPKRHVRLTHNQLAYLHRLVLGPMYESALTSESERRALTQAIAAHNGGYAANSPLPAAAKLVIDPTPGRRILLAPGHRSPHGRGPQGHASPAHPRRHHGTEPLE